MSGAAAQTGDAGSLDGRDVCVLMATYGGETGANLSASLASIAAQSEPVGKVVLVVDGPVGPDQEAVISRYGAGGLPLHLVRLATGGGLARAMNAGLPFCDRLFVMRMDSDDTCTPDRVAVQTAYLNAHPETDLVSSWALEVFAEGAPPQLKASPTEHADVVRALRWRNIIVHPTITVRASTLRAVGAYRPDFGRLEDYDLLVRLAIAGATMHVIPRVLVHVGSSLAQKGRRGGFRYLASEIAFRHSLLRAGFLDLGQFLATTALYAAFRIVSGQFRRRLYALVRS